jgi:hypothetical protein
MSLMLGSAAWLVLGLSAVLGFLQAVPGREDVILLIVVLLLTAGLVGPHALQWSRYDFFGRALYSSASLLARALGAGVYLAGSSARRGVLSSAYRS